MLTTYDSLQLFTVEVVSLNSDIYKLKDIQKLITMMPNIQSVRLCNLILVREDVTEDNRCGLFGNADGIAILQIFAPLKQIQWILIRQCRMIQQYYRTDPLLVKPSKKNREFIQKNFANPCQIVIC